LGFGDHASIDLGAAIIKGCDYRKIVGGGSVGGASSNHGPIGQVERDFVLNGAVEGLFGLVERPYRFESLNNLIALNINHPVSISLRFAIGIVVIHLDVVVVNYRTRIDASAVGHRTELALRFRVKNTIYEQIIFSDVFDQCILSSAIMDLGIGANKNDFVISTIGVVGG
jgi:hypothetical protein